MSAHPSPNPRPHWRWLALAFTTAWFGVVLAACGLLQPASSGEATLQDVINNVQIAGADGKFQSAGNGAGVSLGSQVHTGENSLARLAFSAGPTLRLSSNTSVSMEAPAAPEEVRLHLTAGRLRLSLFGHRFGIVTPLGVIQIDGFGDIVYQAGASAEAGDDLITFRCLSGPCRFQTDASTLDLMNLEALEVLGAGQGQALTRTVLSDLDLRQFMADNPGSSGLLATLTAAPTLTATPLPDTATAPPSATANTFVLSPAPLSTAAQVPATATATHTATRRPVRTAPPRPPASSTPAPTDTAPASNGGGGGGGGGGNPPPTNPPPTQPPPTNPPPPTDTPVPPPTDTPLPPPPPTKPPDPPTDTPSP